MRHEKSQSILISLEKGTCGKLIKKYLIQTIAKTKFITKNLTETSS